VNCFDPLERRASASAWDDSGSAKLASDQAPKRALLTEQQVGDTVFRVARSSGISTAD